MRFLAQGLAGRGVLHEPNTVSSDSAPDLLHERLAPCVANIRRIDKTAPRHDEQVLADDALARHRHVESGGAKGAASRDQNTISSNPDLKISSASFAIASLVAPAVGLAMQPIVLILGSLGDIALWLLVRGAKIQGENVPFAEASSE